MIISKIFLNIVGMVSNSQETVMWVVYELEVDQLFCKSCEYESLTFLLKFRPNVHFSPFAKNMYIILCILKTLVQLNNYKYSQYKLE